MNCPLLPGTFFNHFFILVLLIMNTRIFAPFTCPLRGLQLLCVYVDDWINMWRYSIYISCISLTLFRRLNNMKLILNLYGRNMIAIDSYCIYT